MKNKDQDKLINNKKAKKINNNKIETTLGNYYFSNGEPKQSEKYIVLRYQNGKLEKID